MIFIKRGLTDKKITNDMNIPIVFMTGVSDTDIFKRAQKIKPVVFLEKPVLDSIFKKNN
jgi:FixJ family two-component response regulator